MLSVPSAFSAAQNRMGGTITTVVVVTDGTTTWYFSDRDVQLNQAHAYPILRSHSGIRESVDIYTKKWRVSDVTVNLYNIPFGLDSSFDDLKPEDTLWDIRFNEAEIYILAGDNAPSIAGGGILRFSGVIIDPPEASDDYFTFRISDAGTLQNRKLLQTYVRDDFPAAPEKSVGRQIPIVYGKFTLIGSDTATFTLQGTGLAKGEYITATKAVFSSHVLNALTRIAANVGLPDPALPISVSLDNDDSGYGTGDLSPTSWNTYAWVHATSTEGPFVGEYRNAVWWNTWPVIDGENAIDRDDSTYAQLMDDYQDVVGVQQIERCLFPVVDDSFITSVQAVEYKVTNTRLSVQYKATLTMTADEFEVWLWQDYDEQQKSGLAGVPNADPPDGSWLAASGFAYVPVSKELPYAPGFAITNLDGTGDGTRGNEEMAKLYGIRLRLEFKMSAEAHRDRYAECEGITYGSWISSRSSNYSSGAVIEDPAGIIESILRDQLGLSSSDIDLESFIDAENTSVEARLNLHSDNDLDVNDAIRQLAEQSTFAFFWSAAGKARLIQLDDDSPTTDRTIPWSHIKDGEIKLSKSRKVINKLQVESRWHGEAETYRDNDTYEDSTSQSAVGYTLEYKAKWPNVCGTSASHVAQHLVNSTDGIWSKEHLVVEFTTIGVTNADLEVGSWIELDDETVDPHRKAGGTSWSGRQLLVTDLRQNLDSTKITAIELY